MFFTRETQKASSIDSISATTSQTIMALKRSWMIPTHLSEILFEIPLPWLELELGLFANRNNPRLVF